VNVFLSAGFAGQAELLAEQGQFNKAIESLSKGIELVPEDTLLLLDRGVIYCRVGESSLCLDDFDQVLRIDASPAALLTISRALGRAFKFMPRTRVERLRSYLSVLLQRLPADPSATDVALTRASIQGEILLAWGRPKEALTEFRKADALEAPIHSREYIARALEAAAAKEPKLSSAQAMLHQATLAYSSVALHPEVVWYSPRSYPPGFYADQLEAWLRLASTDSGHQDGISAGAYRLARLRPTVH
jgi:tetratricopeptide (TPR) repeat protein